MGQQSDVRQQMTMRDVTAMRPAADQFLWGAVQDAAGAVGAVGTQLLALGGATLQPGDRDHCQLPQGDPVVPRPVHGLPAEPCRGNDPGGAERDGRRPIVEGRPVVC